MRFGRSLAFIPLLCATACIGCGHTSGPLSATTPPPEREHLIVAAKPLHNAVDPAGLAHVLRAQYLTHTGRLDESLDELRLALIYDEHAAWLQERLVSALLATDRWNEAQAALAQGLRDNQDDPGLNLLAGQLALDDWHFAQARRHLEVALSDASLLLTSGPSYVDARLWLSDIEPTLARARTLMDEHPGDADLAFNIAGILEDHGLFDAARDAYARTRAQRPSDRMAALGEVRVQELQRHAAPAAEALVPLLAYYPDMPELYAELVRLLNEAGRSGADAYRNEALRLTEGDGAARATLAAADIAMGQPTRGVALLHETIASLPHAPEPRLELAEWLRQEGQSDACLGALSNLAETVQVLRVRTHCEAMAGRHEQAMHHLIRLVEISPEPGRVLADMAAVCVGDGNDEQATKRFNTVLKRLRGKLDADQAALARAGFFDALGDGMGALTQMAPVAQRHPDDIDAQLRLADLQTRYGQRRAAVTLLEDLVHEDPFDPSRLNALGFTLADGGTRLTEASVWVHRALRLTPDDAAVWDSLGWLFLSQGRPADAVTWLKRAALRSPGDADVLRHLGDALVALGSRDEARGAYTKALQTRPPQPLRRLIKQRLAVAGGP